MTDQNHKRIPLVWLIVGAVMIITLIYNLPASATQPKANWQKQDQSQDQSQIQDQANQQSISFTGQKKIKIENTPSPDTPNINPSHPCALVWSAGGSIAGLSASGGKAYIDEACNAREWARLMFQMGARDAAIAVMCMQPEAVDSPDCAGIQDYNKELELLTLGHGQLVDENAELRDRIEFLLNERIEDKAACDESVERVGNELNSCLQK